MSGMKCGGLAALTAALVTTGCLPDIGGCDPAAATRLAYDQNGIPAFVGQALVIRNCGDGAFCHVSGATDRFGAPAGLDYDLRVVSTTEDPNEARAAALRAAQDRLLADHGLIWDQVRGNHMPPPGEAGARYQDSASSRFQVPFGSTATPLPSLETPDGQESLRNWIACGAPVVERTLPRSDGQANATGFTAPACDTTCIDPSWPALLTEVIVPGCAGLNCHDSETAAGALDLTGDAATVHGRVVGRPAAGAICVASGGTLISPGDPSASLFYLKVAHVDGRVPCGRRMPISGSGLNSQRLCALSAWIRCGACADPSDPRCAGCVEEQRAGCGLPPGGASDGSCLTPPVCAGRIP